MDGTDEKILHFKRIASAIREKSCPICIRRIDERRAAVLTVCKHAYCIDCIRRWSRLKRNCPLCKAEFSSWFSKITISSRKFEEERLPALEESKKIDVESGSTFGRSERGRYGTHRDLQRSRGELHSVNSRSRPLPWRRSFGRSRFVPPYIVAERVLSWRASIYDRRLQAIPFSSRSCLQQSMSANSDSMENLRRRIEPWIRREIQAILGDPDPSVIVHLATSLWVLSLEEKFKDPSEHRNVEDRFIEPLRPFLHDRTSIFWHELGCFAKSSFTMETYDSVVEYKQLD